MKPIIAVPATLALVYRAYSKKSLTPAGIVAAALTAVAHAVHPWNLPFVLLVVFFLAGTRATHVKKQVKATLTLPASGPSGGGEGPRTHIQVFANSLVASVLTLLHAYQLHQRKQALLALHARPPSGGAGATAAAFPPPPVGSLCYAWGGDLLVVGIIANYACVAADTFSSELGILAKSPPRLITSLTLRKVPPGTNGGVTLAGLAAGLLGSMIVVTSAMLFLPLCTEGTTDPHLFGALAADPAAASWTVGRRRALMVGLTLWGLLGSLVDSLLGGLFQRTVRDVRSGKIVEGEGGLRVIISEDAHEHLHAPFAIEKDEAAVTGSDATKEKEGTEKDTPTPINRYDARNRHRRPSFGNNRPSRVVESGWDLLDNNEVNFLMALGMSLGAMAAAGWYWGVPLVSILRS